ncbi:hypothetical protein X945_5970 [Burkholderia pseudomallei ABCPW 107]|nr:hypothetical protein X945_5970 [Burkholderia pseudomallei ABCPW 107]
MPLPLGPSSTVSGVRFLNSSSRKARKFRTLRYSIRAGARGRDKFAWVRLTSGIFVSLMFVTGGVCGSYTNTPVM